MLTPRRHFLMVLSAISVSVFLACVAHGGEKHEATASPILSSVATFRLFTEGGVSLSLEPRVPMKSERDNEFSKNGELIIRIQGNGKGLMIGNTGSSDVAVLTHLSSVQFLEFTKTGNLMVLTIYDTWDSEAGGFYFVYQRQAWMAPFVKAGVYGTYWGYAKPWD